MQLPAFKMTHPEILEQDATKLGAPLVKIAQEKKFFCSAAVFLAMKSLKLDYDTGEITQDESQIGLETMAAAARVTWSGIQWLRSGRPILRLNPELTETLLRTEVPTEPLDVLPELPFDGFYIVTDKFELTDPNTGLHKGEGIYVCRDLFRDEQGNATLGISIIAIGEDKGGGRGSGRGKGRLLSPGLMRNDAIHYYGISPGMNLRFIDEADGASGLQETMSIVVNMLFLWNSEDSPLELREVTPRGPKSPKKIKRLERKQHSLRKYFSIGIKPAHPRPPPQTLSEPFDGPQHPAWIRGFFRRYWVAEVPEGVQVIETKTTDKGKDLFCIRKFIPPMQAIRRGEAPEQNVYEVKE